MNTIYYNGQGFLQEGINEINSGHRCKTHNAAIPNSATNSPHLQIAFDCHMPKASQKEFIALARQAGFTGIGIYQNFIHLDMKNRTFTGGY